MRIPTALLIATLATALSGCAIPARMDGPPTAFRLTSPAFTDNAMLPRKYAGALKTNPNCDGENVSPPLAWVNAPDKTRSFAILMDDGAGQAGLGVSHWVAYGIPANVSTLAEGEASNPSPRIVGGKNFRELMTYYGPCPLFGNAPQHYVFTLVATDLEPGALPPGLTKPALLVALKGHNLRAASLVLRYAH